MTQILTTPNSDPPFHAGRAWYAVALLFVAYTFAFIDRTILTLMVGPIRTSMQISDTQLSLLHGLAFAVFYTALGIPIGRWVDSRPRVRIIALGVACWSLMTALCGFARSFGQMFLARIGVGVGEAALAPGVYSLLSDLFPRDRLPLAMSVYSSAIFVGGGLALMVGGALVAATPALDLPGFGHFEPWQVTFLIVGLPGLAVALLIPTIGEPVRRGLASNLSARPPVAAVTRHITRYAGAYARMIGGYALLSMVWNGAAAWMPTYLIRVYGWTPREVGIGLGIALAVFGTTGIVTGGLLAQRLRHRRGPSANLLVAIIAGAIMWPAGVAIPITGTAASALAAFTLLVFGASFYQGAAAAALQELTPNQMRGQVTAIYFLVGNLAGIGLGPTVVAMLTDGLFADDGAVGLSIALLDAVIAPLAIFLLWRALGPYARALQRYNQDAGP